MEGTSAAWRMAARNVFLSAYEHVMGGGGLNRVLLEMFIVQKAAYEISYELASRPDWVHLPLAGLLALADESDD